MSRSSPASRSCSAVADTCRLERTRLSRHLAQYPLSPATTGKRQGEGVCPPARHRAPRPVGEMTLIINTCRTVLQRACDHFGESLGLGVGAAQHDTDPFALARLIGA